MRRFLVNGAAVLALTLWGVLIVSKPGVGVSWTLQAVVSLAFGLFVWILYHIMADLFRKETALGDARYMQRVLRGTRARWGVFSWCLAVVFYVLMPAGFWLGSTVIDVAEREATEYENQFTDRFNPYERHTFKAPYPEFKVWSPKYPPEAQTPVPEPPAGAWWVRWGRWLREDRLPLTADEIAVIGTLAAFGGTGLPLGRPVGRLFRVPPDRPPRPTPADSARCQSGDQAAGRAGGTPARNRGPQPVMALPRGAGAGLPATPRTL